jgi:thiol-disulfide isomerase/thioredoxin
VHQSRFLLKAVIFVFLGLIVINVFTKLGEVKEVKPAPEFTAKDVNGLQVSLSDFRGKYVFLDFWSTNCAYCLEEMPEVNEMYQTYSDSLVVIALSADMQREKALRYIESQSFGWLQVLDVIDNDGKLEELYRISGWPTYFLIDRDGKIIDEGRWVLREIQERGLKGDYNSIGDRLLRGLW